MHVGVVVIAVALATTGGYTTRREVQLAVGQSARVRGYTVTYLGPELSQTAQRTTVKAVVHVSGIGTLKPAVSSYPNFAEGIGTPSIHTTLWRDVYLTLISPPSATGQVTIGVQVGTMVMLVWLGGLLMALGTALALIPARETRGSARRARRARGGRSARTACGSPALMRWAVRWIALAVGIVLVVFTVVLAVQHRNEPSVPRLVQEHATAPAFAVTTLDGKQVSSASLRGKTYVVNFFNSWCIPCQQEEPALKAFYAEHKNDPDFAMVGIVHDDDAGAVRSYVNAEKIGWPVALDPSVAVALSYGTTGQPETYVIGPDGTVECGTLGASTQAALDQWLQTARSSARCT